MESAHWLAFTHGHMPYDNQMGCPPHLRGWRLDAHPIQGGGAIQTVPKNGGGDILIPLKKI